MMDCNLYKQYINLICISMQINHIDLTDFKLLIVSSGKVGPRYHLEIYNNIAIFLRTSKMK